MISFVTASDGTHASFRYRANFIKQELLLEGVDCTISPHAPIKADVCIYSKHWNMNDYSDALGARSAGAKIIFDMCDDHFESPYSEHYRRMLAVANTVTCNSDAMKGRIREKAGIIAYVIEDPILGEPHTRDEWDDKWLWFGHPSNWTETEKWLPAIEGKHLEIVSAPFNVKRENTVCTMWSPENLHDAMRRNSISIVPYFGERVETKSPNRVIEALNAEMHVVTNGIPATKELEPFIHSSDSVYEKDAGLRTKEGAAYVRKRFSRKSIVKQWKKVLGI